LFDPSPAAVAAAGYAPDYVSGSNLVNNGVGFQLTSDSNGYDFDELNGGQSNTVAIGLKNVSTLYLLMGAYNGTTFNPDADPLTRT
jgi:hypothetical protein